LQIYAAQILIGSIALAMLAAAAYALDNPLLLEWHNAAIVFQDPAHAQIGLVLLTHQLGYFDILPLYVVLMLAAPAIALIDRFARPLLLPLSLALYLASLTVPFTAPTWPVPGQWPFNRTPRHLARLCLVARRGAGSDCAPQHADHTARRPADQRITATLVWFNWFPTRRGCWSPSSSS
jgi:hypothetical protein